MATERRTARYPSRQECKSECARRTDGSISRQSSKRQPPHLVRKLGDVTHWPGLGLKSYTLAEAEGPDGPGMAHPLVEG